jgi:hypothetical protein
MAKRVLSYSERSRSLAIEKERKEKELEESLKLDNVRFSSIKEFVKSFKK